MRCDTRPFWAPQSTTKYFPSIFIFLVVRLRLAVDKLPIHRRYASVDSRCAIRSFPTASNLRAMDDTSCRPPPEGSQSAEINSNPKTKFLDIKNSFF